ncbi:sulfonate transport system substrate-binding protein [Verrucomicrobium sp. GAS474]|uniref:ABC transporter substrate-binding protein n=1 Tax=Verrucomicrobium sp. GAS474 TaxID=1882831 RepID=UPI00087A8B85|nr:ABC transporter substrate-binding protein [Verrucomicrobium sp. GAS474]SDT85765.1 sulfonate transport system substrate-binding protein [Verrucomicrobium sp. GAS474]
MKALFSSTLLLLAAAALPVFAEDLPQTIRFGEMAIPFVKEPEGKLSGTSLVALAGQLGYWDEEFGPQGPKIVQTFYAGTGIAENEALAQGDLDFANCGGIPIVIGLTGKVPAKIVLVKRSVGAGNVTDIAVRPDSPIKTVDDLRGKRIAIHKGTNYYQILILVLKRHGIEEKDVTIANLSTPEALAAFNAGAVDAVFGGVNILALEAQGKARLLESPDDHKQEASTWGTLVTDRFEKAHPETTGRVIKVLVKTAAWASREENRAPLLAFLQARSAGAAFVPREFEGPLKERFNPLLDDLSLQTFRDGIAFAAEHKLVKAKVDEAVLRTWFIKPDYQRQAIKDLGLDGYWTLVGEGQSASLGKN